MNAFMKERVDEAEAVVNEVNCESTAANDEMSCDAEDNGLSQDGRNGYEGGTPDHADAVLMSIEAQNSTGSLPLVEVEAVVHEV